MLPSFWNKSVTVMRAPKIAGRGDDFRWDWDNAAEHVVTGCFFAVIATGENNDFREGVSTSYVLRMPVTSDVLPSDRVRLSVGEADPAEPIFSIIGTVRYIASATGSQDHKRAELKTWEG